jgi:hypothetical protein
MRQLVAAALTLIIGTSPALLAVGADKAEYVGGTISILRDRAEGVLSTRDENELVFAVKGGQVAIPYARINSLEYGQKAGRRVAVAILISPIALFSKKRNHFLTISYKDENGRDQAGVFELGKDIVRTTLTVLETRTGKQIEYQDDDARKSGLGR